ncbi:peptidase domain-containing ABC transporter [Filimonas effusa]|uniref:Peptidase domain-containing ABC transporter n=1 Tax=Filimonas effusa TaxID=2508721 RepID=A0A4Q1D921_9BACT|nr:peptidase domain-containing ABC transporter [Filimonas effusa]RXK85852.1 peptidase domain-containing ABC transporter [Filimonas effusa]
MKRKYKIFRAYDSVDCGLACVKMISAYYGKKFSLSFLNEQVILTKDGISLLNLKHLSEKTGFNSLAVKVTEKALYNSCPLPCILHWNHDHFVVLYEIQEEQRKKQSDGSKTYKYLIGDPALGLTYINQEDFARCWKTEEKGFVLLLEPTEAFLNREEEKPLSQTYYSLLKNYIFSFKKYILQILLGIFASSFIALSFPVLTQLMVDEGVASKNRSIIFLIILSQALFFAGNFCFEIIRDWLLLHINSRINFHIISDFIRKLFSLPVSFFDSKKMGDFSQRLDDYGRIERFLTGTLLNSTFSFINLLVFSILFFYYDMLIFFCYFILCVVGIAWVMFFQKKRRHIDHINFNNRRANLETIYDIILGMREIRLNYGESKKLNEWAKIQKDYFEICNRSLALEQKQHAGYRLINRIQTIIITSIAIYAVINGQITVGSLLGISYVLGQTNGSMDQIIELIKTSQDASLSLERLTEIHQKPDEDAHLPREQSGIPRGVISIKNLFYQYEGPESPYILKDITIDIPEGKTTAIVGTSGSGKTTLLKLLLKFYPPTSGNIFIDDHNLQDIRSPEWRANCGVVMQDGYIFNSTVADNIHLSEQQPDYSRLKYSLKVANLESFIEGLPSKELTRIGADGNGISGGQKQRILIARAVYKNPAYLFFDEATSNLDATNENSIMNNLSGFFNEKTVIIIAHRLSTVKNADQIIVLDQGEVKEIGNHNSLIAQQGIYYHLVRNQLELAV